MSGQRLRRWPNITPTLGECWGAAGRAESGITLVSKGRLVGQAFSLYSLWSSETMTTFGVTILPLYSPIVVQSRRAVFAYL